MFDREPSARYREYLELHATAHRSGLTRRYEDNTSSVHSGDEAFLGDEICRFAGMLQSMCTTTRAKHVLDFGCGKAKGYSNPIDVGDCHYKNLYDVMGVDAASTFLYDPGVPEFATPPRNDQTFDLVVCTDVLEHIPEEDADLVLDYLFEKANKGVMLSISCSHALAFLQNGQNAHVNVQSPEWWSEKIDQLLQQYKIHVVVILQFHDESRRSRRRIIKTI
jgi:hypothetical protein